MLSFLCNRKHQKIYTTSNCADDCDNLKFTDKKYKKIW